MARADWAAKVLSRSMSAGGNSPGVFLLTVSAADEVVLAQERNGEEGAGSRPQQDVAERAAIGALLGDVGHLDRLAA